VGDIEFVNLPIQDLGNALVSGDVDAAVPVEPILTKLEQSGSIRTLRDGKGLKNSIVPLTASMAFLATHRPVVDAVLKADRRAAEFIAEHPDDAASVLTAEIRQPVETLRASLAKFNFDPTIRPEYIPELKKTEAFLRDQKLLRNSVDIGSFIDLGFTAASINK
jgi:sulfonate transport system substrate-binding protein